MNKDWPASQDKVDALVGCRIYGLPWPVAVIGAFSTTIGPEAARNIILWLQDRGYIITKRMD